MLLPGPWFTNNTLANNVIGHHCPHPAMLHQEHYYQLETLPLGAKEMVPGADVLRNTLKLALEAVLPDAAISGLPSPFKSPVEMPEVPTVAIKKPAVISVLMVLQK